MNDPCNTCFSLAFLVIQILPFLSCVIWVGSDGLHLAVCFQNMEILPARPLIILDVMVVSRRLVCPTRSVMMSKLASVKHACSSVHATHCIAN